MKTEPNLAAEVLNWADAKREKARLRKARAEIKCENEHEYEPETGSGSAPCWKWYAEPNDPMKLEIEDYCAKCKERQKIHEALLKASAEVGRLTRRLMRIGGRKLVRELQAP